MCFIKGFTVHLKNGSLYCCVILNLDFNFLNIISSFSHRVYGSEFKMDVYLRIAQLYLEEQDHVSAEAYINRAAMLHAEVANKHLQITYKVITTCTCIILYSRLFSTVKYFVRKILGCIKFSMRLDRSKIKSYLKFVTPLFVRLKLMSGDRVESTREMVAISSCVQGYHVYKDRRKPRVGEKLACVRESTNIEDRCAVAVVENLDHVDARERQASLWIWQHAFLRSAQTLEVFLDRHLSSAMYMYCTYAGFTTCFEGFMNDSKIVFRSYLEMRNLLNNKFRNA